MKPKMKPTAIVKQIYKCKLLSVNVAPKDFYDDCEKIIDFKKPKVIYTQKTWNVFEKLIEYHTS